MTILWKAVEQSFTVVVLVLQFYSVSNFETFINFGLDTLRNERVNRSVKVCILYLVLDSSFARSYWRFLGLPLH